MRIDAVDLSNRLWLVFLEVAVPDNMFPDICISLGPDIGDLVLPHITIDLFSQI
jgi:hypothetical protein